MSGLFDPYQQWLGIHPEEQPVNLYRLLGVKLFESDPQTIHAAAERRAAYVRARAAGTQLPFAKQLLAEFKGARECLCDPVQKGAYDRALGGVPRASAAPQAFSVPQAAPPVRMARPVAIAVQPAAPPSWQREVAEPVGFGIVTEPSPAYRSRPRSGSSAGILAGLAVVAAAAGIGGYLYAQSRAVPIAKVPTEVAPVAPVQVATPEAKADPTKSDPTKGKGTTKPLPPKNTTVVKPPVVKPPVTDPTTTEEGTNPVQPPVEGKKPPVRDPGEFDDPDIIRRPRSFGGRFDLSSLVAAAQSSDPEATAKPVDPAMFPELKKKLPVPGAIEQSKALNAIRAAYRTDYQQAVLPAGKVSLARMFLTEAAKSIEDSTSRFVYLTEARDLAIDGSSPGLSMLMVDSMARMYAIDLVEMKFSTLSRGAAAAKTNVAQRSISTNALAMIETAIVANDFDSANRLLELGLSSARSAKDSKLVKLASGLRGELKSVADQYKLAQEARTKLETSPADADAHAALGRYLLRAGEWDEALTHLAKGSDAKLQGLAARDLAKPTVANARRELGDAWWDLGEAADEGTKPQYRQRAKHWYEEALGGLEGLTKFQVEFRLKQMADAAGTGEGAPATTVEPSSEPLPPLAKKLVGKYDLLAVEKKTQQRKMAQWELLPNRQATEDGRVVATWDLDDITRMKVTFVDSDRGVIYLRFNANKTQLTGGMTLSTGEMWRWELNRSMPEELRPTEPGSAPFGPGGAGGAFPPGTPVPPQFPGDRQFERGPGER